MSIIFSVSPSYLDALYECSEDFDFKLQGYGSIESASRGLMSTNVLDVIGFIYLANRLPKNLKRLEVFLHKCDLMCSASRRSFIFAIKDKRQLGKLGLEQYKNVDFLFVNTETITNVLIRRDLFGTLLLTRFKPYVFAEHEDSLPEMGIPTLSYDPLFPTAVYKVLSEIPATGDYRYVRFVDQTLADLADSSEVLAALRDSRIKHSCGLDCSEDLVEVKRKIDTVDDVSLYCVYTALYRIICEEVHANGYQ